VARDGTSMDQDVDYWNEKLRSCGRQRLREQMAPDEAFGLVFAWDGVVADTRKLREKAWRNLAEEENLKWPMHERPLHGGHPERIVTDVLRWTNDRNRAKKLSARMSELYTEEFRKCSEPLPGVREWLTALQSVRVPCALACTLPRRDIEEALERMQLRTLFRAVTDEADGMELPSQRFLCSALKLERPPNRCVVFESTPTGITGAHNASMKAVAVMGVHRGYELIQADLTVANMSELAIMNIRRLFATSGHEFMDHQKQPIKPPGQRPRTLVGTYPHRDRGDDFDPQQKKGTG